MSHGATASGNSMLLIGIIAFVIVLVSAGVAYSIWTVRRRIRARSAQRNEHILRPQSAYDPDLLELGNPFRKGEFLEDDPFAVPHNIAAYLPSAPPRAYVAGPSRFVPPGLPPCKASDSARIPLIVTNISGARESIKATIGHTGILLPEKEAHSHLALETTAHESEPVTEKKLVIRDVMRKKCSPGMEEGDSIEETSSVLQDVICPDPPGPMYLAQSSATELPSPPITPTLPTLVVTSASMQRGSFIEPMRSEMDYLPSPPATPTVVLTSPSIHCGLDSDPDPYIGRWADGENWSDTLELEDYVDEKTLLGRPSLETPKQLQTPPQTPTFLQTPIWGSRVDPSPDNEPRVLSSQSDDRGADVPFDHAAFHARIAAFTLAHKRADAENRLAFIVRRGDPPMTPSSSQSSVFDYERVLARKRSPTVSAKPTRPKPLALSIQVPPRARRVAWTPPMPRRPGDF